MAAGVELKIGAMKNFFKQATSASSLAATKLPSPSATEILSSMDHEINHKEGEEAY